MYGNILVKTSCVSTKIPIISFILLLLGATEWLSILLDSLFDLCELTFNAMKRTMNIVFAFNLPYLGDDFDFHCEDCCWASLVFLIVLQQNFTQVQGSVNDVFMQLPVYSFCNQIVLTQDQNMLGLNSKQEQD